MIGIVLYAVYFTGLTLVLMTSHPVMSTEVMNFNTCIRVYNEACDFACQNDLNNCYLHNWYNVCPCVVNCHVQHCMQGIMAEVCPACAIHVSYCKEWHKRIELHSCGNQKFESVTALSAHCASLNTCVSQCPLPAQCITTDYGLGGTLPIDE